MADDWINRQLEQNRQAAARAAVHVSRASNPDVAARANSLSRRTGVPADVVERNLPDVESREKARQRQRIVQEGSPYLQNWMADPRNAAAAGDDTPTLAKIAENERNFRPGPPVSFGSYARGLWNSFTASASQQFAGALRSFVESNPTVGTINPATGVTRSVIPQNIRPAAQYARNVGNRAEQRRQETTPAFESDWARSVYGGVSSFAQMLPGMAASVLTRSPAPALATAGGQTYYTALDKYTRRGAGIGEARVSAGGEALTEVLTELVPAGHAIRAITGTGKGFVREIARSIISDVPGEQLATHIQDAIDTATTGGGTWAEYRESRGQAAMDTAIATLTQGALSAGVGAAARVAVRHAETRLSTTLLDQVMADAATTKLRETDPEAFRQFIDGVTQNTPMENVYIPAEAVRDLLQSDPEHPLAALVAEQMDDALALEGDVVIPLSDVATHLAGTPEWESLKGEARFSPGGMSEAELATLEERYSAELDTRAERLSQQAEEGMKAAEPEAQVFAEINQQLLDAGYRPTDAQKVAALYAANAATFGGMRGQDALAYHRENPVEIRRNDLTGGTEGRTLNAGSRFTATDRFYRAVNDPGLFLAESTGRNGDILGRGVYVTNSPEYARLFGSDLREMKVAASSLIDEWEIPNYNRLSGAQQNKWARANGYEGIRRSVGEGVYDWVIFDPGHLTVGEPYRSENDERTRDGRELDDSGAPAPLDGSPEVGGQRGPIAGVVDAARRYAAAQGIPFTRQARYAEIDEAFSTRLADAYAAMEHNPGDPLVQEAYADLIRQTRAQYDALVEAGYSFSFFDDDSDPYDGKPWRAMADLRENNRLAVYATTAGFGSNDALAADNPLLADTGLTWPDPNGVQRPVLANDLFRAVHDVFGHGLEGAGFRAQGEENAWQAHARLFTGPALAALTTETRGQNSWLNFGPYGEANQEALLEDTTFADQKTGLLPEWAWTENRVEDEQQRTALPDAIEVDGRQRPTRNSDGQQLAPTEEGVRNFWRWFGDSKVVDDEGRPLVVYHGTRSMGDFDAFQPTMHDEFVAWGTSFSPDRSIAEDYANDAYGVRTRADVTGKPGVIAAYIASDRLPDAMDLMDEHEEATGLEIGEQPDGALEQFGIANGARAVLPFGSWNEIFVFDPTAIKATDNTGAFNPGDPRILHQAPVAALLEPDEIAAVDDEGNATIGWTQGRIDALLRAYGYPHEEGRSKAFAVRMSPDEFLRLTASPSGRALIENRVDSDEYGGEIDFNRMAGNTQPVFLVAKVNQPYTVNSSEGTTEIPEAARVMGHEGRHRMTMLKRAGVTNVPVVVIAQGRDLPSSDSIELQPQRSRSDQLASGDTATTVQGVTPISYANRDALRQEFGQGRVLFQTEPFFSALERAAEAVSANRAPGQQWAATLKKAPGVKVEELELTGVLEWLAEQDGPVTKEQVVAFIQAGGIQLEETVKSSDEDNDDVYTRQSELQNEAWESEFSSDIEEIAPEEEDTDEQTVDMFDPGHVRAPNKVRYQAIIDPPSIYNRTRLTNEVLPDAEGQGDGRSLSLGLFDTEEEAQAAIDDASRELFDAYTENGWGDEYYSQAREEAGPKYSTWITRPGEGEDYTEILLRLPPGVRGNPERMAKNSHWEEQDVVAHIRFDTRTDDEGNTVMVLHEVQSDAHQEGQKRGYNKKLSNEEREALESELQAVKAEQFDLRETPEYVAYEKRSSELADAVEQAVRAYNEQASEFTLLTAWSPRMLRSGHMTREELRERVVRELPAGVDPAKAGEVFDRAMELQDAEGDARQAYNKFNDKPHAVRLAELYDLEHSLGTKLDNNSGVPDMPFKGTGYVALAMKRAMFYAAQHGYDRVVWIRGEMQNGQDSGSAGAWFYNEWNVGKDGKRRPGVLRSVTDELLKKFAGKGASEEEIEADKAATEEKKKAVRARQVAIGNEISALYSNYRLNNTSGGEIEGDEDAVARVRELRVEEQQARSEMYELSKRKPLGSNRVQKFLLPDLEPDEPFDGGDYDTRDPWEIEQDIEEAEGDELDELKAELEEAMNERDERAGFLGFDVTAGLQNAAREGFPLFQRNTAGPRGRISGGIIGGQAGPTVIELFEKSDPSTIIHELGHLFTERLRAIALSAGAPAQVQGDWAALKTWWAENGIAVNDADPIPTEAHELTARGFERYTMEGKAPSSRLQAAFNAFRSWMLTVYEVVANLRSPIKPEVRRVFDRMLATQEEIDEAADVQQTQARFESAEQAGMTQGEFDAYRQLADAARTEAFDALLFRTMTAIRRERTKAWQAEQRRVREDVTEQVNARPEFRAIHLLRTGRFLDDPEREPVKLRLDREWLEERFGADVISRLPKGTPIFGEPGDNPDDIASMVGFDTGSDLVNALLKMEEAKVAMKADGDTRSVKERVIADETAAIMAERHGDPMNDGSIEEEALAAIHNDREGELIAAENRQLARRSNQRPTAYSMARAWAARKIAQGRVNDVASKAALQRYARAQAKAAKGFEAALLSQDIDEAFRQSEIRLLNHALIAEAKKAADRVEVATDRLTKLSRQRKRKSVDQEYFDRALSLLEKFEFRPRSQRLLNEMDSFAAWAAAQAANGVDVIVPPRLESGGVHWSRMTVEELTGLDDSVQQLLHLGRRKKSLVEARERVEYEERRDRGLAVVEDIPQKAVNDNLNPSTFDRLKNKLASADAALLKMEQVFDWLDAGNPNGFFNTYIFRPIAEAQNRERDMIGDYLGQVRELMRGVPKKVLAKWEDSFSDPRLLNRETGRPFKMQRQDLIAMALNVGNEGNFDKLARGYGWNADTIMEVLSDELTAEEWQFVQNTWDMVNSLWPEIEALEKRVNGVAPPKIEARSFEVFTAPYEMEPNADGDLNYSYRTMTLRGGYYPVVYDPSRSYRTEELQGKETDALFSSGYQRASTRQGFAKERTEAAYPIHLSLSVLNRHLTTVIHDLTHREIIMQSDRILSDRKVVKAVDDALGSEVRKQFRPWLSHIANEWAREGRELSGIDTIAKKLRTHSTIIGMGLRLSSILSQVAGYAGIVEMIGPRWWASGMRAYGNPIDSFNFVAERSQEVRHRMDTLDRDINSGLQDLAGRWGMLSQVRKFAFFGIAVMDRTVVTAGWIGAYNKGMSEGMTETEAAYYADKVIRTTQGAGGAKDLAALQRGGEWLKLATMFYSYASAFYNRQRALGRDVRHASVQDMPALTARALMLFVVGPVLGQLPGALMGGFGPDEDEGETWTGWTLRLMAANFFYGVPIARDIASSVATGFDYSFTPATRAVDTVMRAAGDAVSLVDLDEETQPSKRAVKTGVEAVGYVSRLPVGQVANAAQFITDWANGEADPDGVWDWLKGLQRGKLEEE